MATELWQTVALLAEGQPNYPGPICPGGGDTFMLALLFGQAYLIFQLSWEQGQFECGPCLLSLILQSHQGSGFPWICP